VNQERGQDDLALVDGCGLRKRDFVLTQALPDQV
jgi:hypothetical protein